MKDKLLVIVDFQNDFCTGSLAVPSYRDAMIPLMKLINSDKFDLIYTKDLHPADHSSFINNGGQWPSHCVEGTTGSDILPGIYVSGSRIVNKGQDKNKEEYGAKILDLENYKNIYVCGIAYEYCVASTAIEIRKLYPNVSIVMDASACIDKDAALAINNTLYDNHVKFSISQHLI